MEAIRQPWIRTPSAARSRILQRSRICDQHGAPPVVHEVLHSPGQPLDAATRAFMEPRFGVDFGGVRVHADARAAESARAVNALAYTVGRSVVFGAGQYAPSTAQGQRLLAHELVHTLQQRFANPSPTALPIGESQDGFEQAAKQMALRVSTHDGA